MYTILANNVRYLYCCWDVNINEMKNGEQMREKPQVERIRILVTNTAYSNYSRPPKSVQNNHTLSNKMSSTLIKAKC